MPALSYTCFILLPTFSPPGWHSDGPIGFPEIDGRVAMHTLRFGYFLSDTLHPRSGTVENIRGSHRSMRAAYAQQGTASAALHFKPVTENEPYQSSDILAEGDKGEDPALYSPDHHVVKGRQGTIFAFQVTPLYQFYLRVYD
eukprot:SAG22_NODE_1390_length_4520_cov_1.529744_2_plen_142_part_00